MEEANENKTRALAVQTLSVLLVKMRVPQASYELLYDGTKRGDGFTYQVVCGDLRVTASGNSKKNAKNTAAMLMIHQIKQNDQEVEEVAKGETKASVWWERFPLAALQRICLRQELPRAEYEAIEDLAPVLIFETKCTVATLSRRGKGRSKKESKREAARNMILLLSETREGVKVLLDEMETPPQTTKRLCESDSPMRLINARDMNPVQSSIEVPDQQSNPNGSVDLPESSKVLRENENNITTNAFTAGVNTEPREQQLIWLPKSNLCRRRYFSQRLRSLSSALEQSTATRTDESICYIYSELKRILMLLGVVPDQMIQRTHDGKFMMALYLSTDPRIADVAVDADEVDLKVLIYHRTVKRLLDMVLVS